MQSRTPWIRILRDFLCGFLIGGGAILPGVSGGVLAVVFGIYQPCMEILISPKKALPKYWKMLPPLGLGVVMGFFLFAKGVTVLFALSDAVAVWLFIGLILGTVPQLFREAGKEGRSRSAWVALAVCFFAMFSVLWLVSHGASRQVTPGFGWYAFSGVLFGVGTIIPGMTTSSVLMALGLYEPVLNAMTELNIPVLAVIAPGVVLSILLMARMVNWLFQRYHALAFHGILGIVLASTAVIVPVSYASLVEILLSAVCCAGGFGIACLMDRLDERGQKKN